MKVAAVALSLLVSAPAFAANCPVMDDATSACQDAVGKAGFVYLKKHLRAVGKCLTDFQKGTVTGPDADSVCRGTSLAALPSDQATANKLTNAVSAASAKIANKCTDGIVANLDLCAPTVGGLSCVLDEHYATADSAIGAQVGMLVTSSDPGQQACQAAIVREGRKFLTSEVKALQVCLKNRQKDCGNPEKALTRCLARREVETRPEDTLVKKRTKNGEKLATKLGQFCTDAQAAASDACGDTVADLNACLACNHASGAETAIGDQYRVVRGADPGDDLLAIAADTDPGDTILLEPGIYETTGEITIQDTEVTILGHKVCGSTDTCGVVAVVPNRARIIPAPGPAPDNGIYACGSLLPGCPGNADGLLMAGIEVGNFDDNDMYQVGLNGVTYRDTITYGPHVTDVTRYGPFPVQGNDVLIEDSIAHNISDAAIYVGQTTNIVVRNNEVCDSVAGIEIENSANALVEDNYAHDNAAGILVFKLAGLPVQLTDCHTIRNNISTNNNGVNYGSGLVGDVPSGTGMFILSADTTVIQGNTLTNNNSWGIAVVDQATINFAITPPPFPVLSPDQNVNDNSIVGNTMTGNGGSPDPGAMPFQGDAFFLPLTGASGNCQSGNTFATDYVGLFAALPACPSPPAQPGCPLPPLTPPTTTTSTTTPSSTTTSTTVSIYTFTQLYNDILFSKCGPCHGNALNYAGLDQLNQGQANAYADLVNVPATETIATSMLDRVEPNDATLSYLMHKLDGTHLGGAVQGSGVQMPAGGPFLDLWQRDAIRAWINGGAPND
jgi:parallel beta-helix repeat protein